MTKEEKLKVAKNIKTIRCYLELTKTEFGEKTGIGKRAIEFETKRFVPTSEELKKIADFADIKVEWIMNFTLQTKLEIY